MVKEEAKIKVRTERRRYGKKMTVVKGIEKKADPKSITKMLKSKLACGGTFKDGRIELQGDHKQKVKTLLVKAGFKEEQIEVD